MTLVNVATGEVVQTLDERDARRLTDRIRLLAESVADQIARMADLIEQARVGSAWLALGYRSWPEYVAGEFAGILPRLDREPRQEFVRELAARGMSTRAIAPVVGQSHMTVARDLAGVTDVTPQTPGGGVVPAHFEQGATTANGTATPRPPVTGIDGKTYTRPVADRRRPLTDTARDLGLDIRKLAERAERFAADDRFDRNKNEVATHLRHHLDYALKVLADLDAALNSHEGV